MTAIAVNVANAVTARLTAAPPRGSPKGIAAPPLDTHIGKATRREETNRMALLFGKSTARQGVAKEKI